MTDRERRYRVTFNVAHHPDGVTQRQVNAMAENTIGCDAVLVVSIIGEPDDLRPYFIQSMSVRGSTEAAIAPAELFTIWTMLANALAEMPDLEHNRREYCAGIFAEIRAAALGWRTSH